MDRFEEKAKQIVYEWESGCDVDILSHERETLHRAIASALRTAVKVGEGCRPTPNGYVPLEAYGNGKEIVVIGTPIQDTHNCDAMGCSSTSHVLLRTTRRHYIPQAAQAAQEGEK